MRRYDITGEVWEMEIEESPSGNWVRWEDVSELETSHQRLLDVLNLVLENDMGSEKTAAEFGGYVLDEDVRAAIQAAISKSIQ